MKLSLLLGDLTKHVSPGKGCADRGIAGYKSYGQIREREGGGEVKFYKSIH